MFYHYEDCEAFIAHEVYGLPLVKKPLLTLYVNRIKLTQL